MSVTYPTVLVRIVRPVRHYRTGQIVPVTGGFADTLCRAGYAVKHEQPQLEFATAPQPLGLERAEAPVAKAGRRRRAV